jgi:apolipoprotein N-acyltransferase
VPFGEYVPLGRFLAFVNRLVPAAGDFDMGDKVAPLKHEGLSAGILICFEVIFPELARAHARKGANILVNLTNDAWFGMTSAPYQHLSMAVFRSVENRLPTIRAANTGFSAFISPRGEILAQSDLFTEAVLKVSVDISEPTLSFYSRYGDLFVILLLFMSLIKIFYCLWRTRGRDVIAQ